MELLFMKTGGCLQYQSLLRAWFLVLVESKNRNLLELHLTGGWDDIVV